MRSCGDGERRSHQGVGAVRPGHSSLHVSDEGLTQILTSLAPEDSVRVVEVLERRPNPFASSFPSEIVECRWADGAERPILIKEHMAGIHDGYGYWEGAGYEASVYLRVLAGLDLGTPRYLGSWLDEAARRHFMAIEYVSGLRLNKAPMERLADVARWTATLHARASARAMADEEVRRYDDSFFRGWSGRALEFIRQVRPASSWVRPLMRYFDTVCIPQLLAADQVLVHGELYPENVIVSPDRVCTVDWQSAAIGAGEIDLASLLEGYWPEDIVARCWETYTATRIAAGLAAPSRAAYEAAQLYWPIRWLGHSLDDTALPERARYLDHLERAAISLGLEAPTSSSHAAARRGGQ